MLLILNSFVLSLRVTPRMVFPSLAISLASIVVWMVLDIFTLGLAGHVSEPITSAFISLFGIHAALALKGETRRTDYRALVL
nr:hypothetical protein [uncultured Ruegeria sp.]